MERKLPTPGEKFIHFKKKLYQIICMAEHSETGEKMVVYQALYGDFACYTRPLEMFMSEVDHEKYPDVVQKYRFERVDKSFPQEGAGDARKADVFGDGQDTKPVEVSELLETNAAVTEDIAVETQVDPALLAFLDADSLEEKYNILVLLQGRITDSLIDSFAVCLDVVIPQGDVRVRYQQLVNSIRTMQKYESTRLR